ncbi:MAG: hypothetical protein N4A72_13430 [Bacteroidales bacterium]|jgi:hypothetical protein|nr:hypothetical protein [Bacteroidales bacterium]
MKVTLKQILKLGLIANLLLVISCSNESTKSEKEDNQLTKTELNNIPEFDIKFPETEFKVEKTENRDLRLGDVVVTNWILQGKDKNGPFMYFVSHSVVSNELKSKIDKNPQSLYISLKSMLKGSAIKLGGTDFDFNPIEYKGFKGVESECKVFNGDGIIKSKVYKINNHIFMISAGGKRIDLKSVTRFINSFELK